MNIKKTAPLILFLICASLAACGSKEKPDTSKKLATLTLERDAPLVEQAYDADGDPVIRQVGSVPKGATCSFDGKSVWEGSDQGLYAAVQDCTLNGVNHGSGAVSIERFVETDELRKLFKRD
jgi:hypothetical protein